MKEPLLVAATGWDGAEWARRMEAELPGRMVFHTERDGSFAGDPTVLAGVAYLLAWKPRPEIFGRLPDLRVILSLGAGVDALLGVADLPDVPITRIIDPDLTARMTEYVVWQVLHHHRRAALYARQQRERRWRDIPQAGARDLTVGILGLGTLGAAAADVLLRLGFRVAGWTRTAKTMPGIAMHHGPAGLDGFLAATDILVSLLLLTAETRGILDARLLGKLRRDGPLGGPVLINSGRGGSQVEADIAAALREGTLNGASLDVFETEPLPTGSPLWALENLVITPHNAAESDPAALSSQIARQIEAFERGEPLVNLVDRRRGY